MGNCLRPESQEQWGGEDWSPIIISNEEKKAMKMEEELEELMGFNGKKKGRSSSTASNSTTEVKVKITKKQLEKLLRGFDAQQQQDVLSVHNVLSQLIKSSAHYETHQRSGWKPRLQSIPEI